MDTEASAQGATVGGDESKTNGKVALMRRQTERPAVGIVATPDNADSVVTSVLRGQCRSQSYDTIVCHDGIETCESVIFAKQLGAPVIEVPRSADRRRALSEALSSKARELGYPGILFHDNPGINIDFDASTAQLSSSDEYLIEAIPEGRIQSTGGVLTAIPAYNEEETISKVVTAAREYADNVVVIDDCSSDSTARVASNAGAEVIRHSRNKGYGGALKTAFIEAERCHADVLIVLDGDGQHDPQDIPRLLQVQRERNAELVIGSRRVDDATTDMPLYRRLGFQVINILTNLSLGSVRLSSMIRDTQSGFRLYSRAAVQTLAAADLDDNMSASTDIIYHAKEQGYAIEEVGVDITYDVENANSHHPISHGLQLIESLQQRLQRRRPLSSVGIPGAISLCFGLGLLYWSFIDFMTTGVFHLDIVILSLLLNCVGLVAFLTGIVIYSVKFCTT